MRPFSEYLEPILTIRNRDLTRRHLKPGTRPAFSIHFSEDIDMSEIYSEPIGTATYSPEDNKLRLYPFQRLDAHDYARVKEAGFKWAPKQELFVAPAWTPAREDLLLELCGEIEDEDKSLVERQEERAERFEDYSDKRGREANQARAAVSAIADGIPLGQPILVGHHSERRARKDAERIQNGMGKAVQLWRTSQYWLDRARGAITHAKYKELPAVRARRIKTIEADKRKAERTKAEVEKSLAFWSKPEIGLELAKTYCNFYDHGGVKLASGEDHWSAWSALDGGKITVAEVKAQRAESLPRLIAHYQRWIEHYENRLAYERAMLQEAGGIVADRVKPEKGGACKCWVTCLRREWAWIVKVNKVSVTVLDNWGNGGKDFTRTIPFDKLTAVMSKAQVDEARAAGRIVGETSLGFHLADEPVKARPEPKPADTQGELFEAMADTLKAGVQVVSAPQLFPTPPELAEQVAQLAEIRPGHSVLEPSAGTGRLIEAVAAVCRDIALTTVEINQALHDRLSVRWMAGANHVRADFLECNGELGQFDRIVMNPPFQNAEDIKQILHALGKLKAGGRLVAVCANGPRQQATLQPLATAWIDLPTGSFREEGTNVNAAIVVIEK
jgi:protein-L-isoaspartate O-methyltransferase